ncbi:MAG: hypothetical protein J0G32_01750 [Alphaproteobacteria bacterium]|mgnify:FL=1|nr:hypothetical protein [Alphaproteobacteria bacterium]OJV12142.1 MAG: hypothetical protein BGO27_05330 [Alphaproteobacteria bacterium 33-17]
MSKRKLQDNVSSNSPNKKFKSSILIDYAPSNTFIASRQNSFTQNRCTTYFKNLILRDPETTTPRQYGVLNIASFESLTNILIHNSEVGLLNITRNLKNIDCDNKSIIRIKSKLNCILPYIESFKIHNAHRKQDIDLAIFQNAIDIKLPLSILLDDNNLNIIFKNCISLHIIIDPHNFEIRPENLSKIFQRFPNIENLKLSYLEHPLTQNITNYILKTAPKHINTFEICISDTVKTIDLSKIEVANEIFLDMQNTLQSNIIWPKYVRHIIIKDINQEALEFKNLNTNYTSIITLYSVDNYSPLHYISQKFLGLISLNIHDLRIPINQMVLPKANNINLYFNESYKLYYNYCYEKTDSETQDKISLYSIFEKLADIITSRGGKIIIDLKNVDNKLIELPAIFFKQYNGKNPFIIHTKSNYITKLKIIDIDKNQIVDNAPINHLKVNCTDKSYKPEQQNLRSL